MTDIYSPEKAAQASDLRIFIMDHVTGDLKLDSFQIVDNRDLDDMTKRVVLAAEVILSRNIEVFKANGLTEDQLILTRTSTDPLNVVRIASVSLTLTPEGFSESLTTYGIVQLPNTVNAQAKVIPTR